MNKRVEPAAGAEGRYLSIGAVQRYTGLGRSMAARLGRESGAIRKYGRRVVYDRVVIDEYMATLSDTEQE